MFINRERMVMIIIEFSRNKNQPNIWMERLECVFVIHHLCRYKIIKAKSSRF